MSEHIATIKWQRGEQTFTDNRYSRGHEWIFDGGLTVPASPSPSVVPLPYSVEENIDPEEAFVASLSSCHMLFFLSIAATKGFCVDDYQDDAVGEMGKNEQGRTAMLTVRLRPKVQFKDKTPTDKELEKLHQLAHKQCFLANSVNCQVVTEIR